VIDSVHLAHRVVDSVHLARRVIDSIHRWRSSSSIENGPDRERDKFAHIAEKIVVIQTHVRIIIEDYVGTVVEALHIMAGGITDAVLAAGPVPIPAATGTLIAQPDDRIDRLPTNETAALITVIVVVTKKGGGMIGKVVAKAPPLAAVIVEIAAALVVVAIVATVVVVVVIAALAVKYAGDSDDLQHRRLQKLAGIHPAP
jgi:hypothetical protein